MTRVNNVTAFNSAIEGKMATFLIDFNGFGAGGNNTTSYNDAGTNTPVTVFGAAAIFANGANLANLVLNIASPSSTMAFTFTTTAQTAATNAGVALSFNSTTGNISFTYTSGAGHTTAPSDTVWNTILDGLQYNNTVDQAVGTTHAITLVSATPTTGTFTSSTANNTETINVTCFMPGTLIATPNGDVAVEALRPGDLVLTSAGEAKPVNWVGRQTVSKRFADPLRAYPIRVRAGALANNTPSRDLFVSPDHALLVGGVMANAGALVNGTSITRELTIPDSFVYYHVELDDHSLILAEGAPAETFVDNVDRMRFDNWDEFLALYPDGKTVTELPYARAKSNRQVPVSVRIALAERAISIGATDASQVA